MLDFEAYRAALGDQAVDGECGPIVEFPAEWGRWALAEHRAIIAEHRAESERIAREESRR